MGTQPTLDELMKQREDFRLQFQEADNAYEKRLEEYSKMSPIEKLANEMHAHSCHNHRCSHLEEHNQQVNGQEVNSYLIAAEKILEQTDYEKGLEIFKILKNFS